MVSYTPKFNKSVVLISTVHHDKNVMDRLQNRYVDADLPDYSRTQGDKKPEIIMYYNENKMGCDALDQLCANNTCRRRTNRWPFNVFCFLIDAAVQNAYTLFSINKEARACARFRQESIESLAMEICLLAAKERVEELKKSRFTGIGKFIQSAFEAVGIQIRDNVAVNFQRIMKRARCAQANCIDKNMHSNTCNICNKPVCRNHCEIKCNDCIDE